MKCINESHDHTETIDGEVVQMKCAHCGERTHYDQDVSDYIHDWVEHTCWLHRANATALAAATPCRFNVREVLDSVLPEFTQSVNWSFATAQETSDLLNNLRDGFSEFWGVRV